MSLYRAIEEAEVDQMSAPRFKRYGGRNRIVDTWLIYGIGRALQSIHRGRWNRHDPLVAEALDCARDAVKVLERAAWLSMRRNDR